jgi:hypothetical protein
MRAALQRRLAYESEVVREQVLWALQQSPELQPEA